MSFKPSDRCLYKPGDTIELEIHSLDKMWRGVADVDGGWKALVPTLFPGDRASVTVSAVSNHHSIIHCWLNELISSSHARIPSFCSIYPACMGCKGCEFSYQAQLEWKTNLFKSYFPSGDKIIPSPDIFGYRTKAKLIAGVGKNGKTILGGYGNRTHDIIELTGCMVTAPRLRELFVPLAALTEPLRAYDEIKHEGFLRSVFMKVNSTKEILITFVVLKEPSPWEKSIIRRAGELDGVVGVTVNINPDKGNRLTGSVEYSLVGVSQLLEQDHPIPYFVNATAFSQVNHKMAGVIYKKICQWVSPHVGNILDLYSGNGPIALALGAAGHSVTGIEREGDAINLANKAIAAIKNNDIRFIKEDLNETSFIAEYMKNDTPQLIVVNPPRSGLSDNLCNVIGDSSLTDMIYMSCSPHTLARDLKILNKHGFKIDKISFFDMFPHTPHFESLIYIKR
jgi:23S rRNA (uracil1939-C5)-methyltransferase